MTIQHASAITSMVVHLLAMPSATPSPPDPAQSLLRCPLEAQAYELLKAHGPISTVSLSWVMGAEYSRARNAAFRLIEKGLAQRVGYDPFRPARVLIAAKSSP